jgi:PPK2 family polyphosphate:nucleotide phosphotransferase
MQTAILTAKPDRRIRLSEIDPAETGGMKKDQALKRTAAMKQELIELQPRFFADGRQSLLIVLQAMDTGGKDGAVKNLCREINPAGLHLAAFKTPTRAELDHDFLWRAHLLTPAKGMIGIWNRSHYEDVLIVRVHKLVKKAVWSARYRQINRFEKILVENGTTILKFMLHISRNEQKKRLQARLDDPEKQWKFNPLDLKERSLWREYQRAYEDMINACSTRHAPWHIIPANHKWARDLGVVEMVLRTLKKMRPRYPTPSFDPKAIRVE